MWVPLGTKEALGSRRPSRPPKHVGRCSTWPSGAGSQSRCHTDLAGMGTPPLPVALGPAPTLSGLGRQVDSGSHTWDVGKGQGCTVIGHALLKPWQRGLPFRPFCLSGHFRARLLLGLPTHARNGLDFFPLGHKVSASLPSPQVFEFLRADLISLPLNELHHLFLLCWYLCLK